MSESVMCPILTAAALAPKPKVQLVGVGGQSADDSEAVACIRSACAWYVPIADEKGVVQGGSCAVTLLPTSLAQITGGLRGMVGVVSQAAKLPVIPSKG